MVFRSCTCLVHRWWSNDGLMNFLALEGQEFRAEHLGLIISRIEQVQCCPGFADRNNFASSCLTSFRSMAASHRGKVRLHRRCFAHWFRYTFARCCPLPHIWSDVNVCVIQLQWQRDSGERYFRAKDRFVFPVPSVTRSRQASRARSSTCGRQVGRRSCSFQGMSDPSP